MGDENNVYEHRKEIHMLYRSLKEESVSILGFGAMRTGMRESTMIASSRLREGELSLTHPMVFITLRRNGAMFIWSKGSGEDFRINCSYAVPPICS
ncbi:MAG: hypothetical protein ABSC55_13650 [Syntrophorhabdales bacterium]|jgi:hypothetical protein